MPKARTRAGHAVTVAPEIAAKLAVLEAFAASGISKSELARRIGVSENEARQAIMNRFGGIPVGRTGRPAEIAELVAFLASDRGGFACGVDYIFDGGVLPSV